MVKSGFHAVASIIHYNCCHFLRIHAIICHCVLSLLGIFLFFPWNQRVDTREMGVRVDDDDDTGLGLEMSIGIGAHYHSDLSDHRAGIYMNKLSRDGRNSNNMAFSGTNTVSSFHMDFNFVNQEGSHGISMKRERDAAMEDFEMEKSGCRMSDGEEDGGVARKKLRLSKDQSALLEESFKENSTLIPKQKQALAKQLNLRPRQVEVWFQNRRARTKLKQTEVDCEFLKGCYESLTEENKRLQKELAQLRSLKLSAASPLYMKFPTPTLTMCPSCEKVVTSDNIRPFASLPKPQFISYTHSSLAC